MSEEARDLPATVVRMCKDLCDIAHALSRATCMPDPKDDEHKRLVKLGLEATAFGVKEVAVSVMTLGVIAGFDTSEVKPDGMSDETYERALEKARAMAEEKSTEEEAQEARDEALKEHLEEELKNESTLPDTSDLDETDVYDVDSTIKDVEDAREEAQEEEPDKPMGVQELLAKLKDRRGNDEAQNGG